MESDIESTGEPSDDDMEEEDEANKQISQEPNVDLPAEYWQIGKLVKYLNVQNEFLPLVNVSWQWLKHRVMHFHVFVRRVGIKRPRSSPCVPFAICH